jgi:hypothetical protein
VVELDIRGVVATITDGQAEQLRNAAEAEAGRSDAHRDLALLIDRALRTHKRVALQRGERRALDELLARDQFSALQSAVGTDR